MIEIQEDLNKNILTFNIVKVCDVNEIASIIKKNYGKGYNRVLWKVNSGTISHLTRENFIEIAIATKNYSSQIKSACIGSDDLEYGMLRMYKAYSKNIINHEVRIFRNKDDAISWLIESKMTL